MKQKIIAAIAGVALVSVAAVGAFASQDAIRHENDDASATATSTATNTTSSTSTATATSTPTPAKTDRHAASDAENTDQGERDIKGIPTANPSHKDDDGDGICEKGEVVVKTVTSGVMVRVPCHPVERDGAADGASDEAESNGHAHASGAGDTDKADDVDEPEANDSGD